MATIRPFKAIRYNLNKINIKDVIAPPYDVISKNRQNELYQKSDYNVIRLILGKEFPDDTEKNNKYSRANNFLQNWIKKNILIQEKTDCLYIYQQDYEVENKKYSRTGILCILKQEPLFGGVIYPHEKTLSKPKADRLNLTRECKTNFSPIFGLYNDEKNKNSKIIEEIKKSKPTINFIDENNERNIIWIIQEKSIINEIINNFKNKKIFIADGHHRYETSMNYTKEMIKQNKKGNFNFILSFLCNMNDSGLVIFPTHRVLNLKNLNIKKFIINLQEFFNIKISDKDNIKKELQNEFINNNIAFGLYTKEKKYYILILKNKENYFELI